MTVENLTERMRSVSSLINSRLSNSESALLLRELYFEHFDPPLDPDAEKCLGAVAYRFDKEPVISDMLTSLLLDYKRLRVKDHLGISIEEYMNTTPIVRDVYNQHLETIIEEENEKLDELKNTIDGVEHGQRNG